MERTKIEQKIQNREIPKQKKKRWISKTRNYQNSNLSTQELLKQKLSKQGTS